jgi:transcriptional regulator with XRE-family HTH domain
MRRIKASTASVVAGRRETQSIAATLGRDVRAARRRRHLTQAQVAERAGCSRARYAELERGNGASATLELWVRVGFAVGRPLAVGLSRETSADGAPGVPLDAGHLAAQELVLRLGRGHGWQASVELATSTARVPHVADVVLRNDIARVLILLEIVNRAGDLGAVARATDRKASDIEAMAILAGDHAGPYRVAVAWLLVESAANRRLVATYPEFLRTRFRGSSALLAASLMDGAPPPPGEWAVAWIDPAAGRVFGVRWKTVHGAGGREPTRQR